MRKKKAALIALAMAYILSFSTGAVAEEVQPATESTLVEVVQETPKAEAPSAPAQEAPKAEAPSAPVQEAPKAETPSTPAQEAPKAEAPSAPPASETPKAETPSTPAQPETSAGTKDEVSNPSGEAATEAGTSKEENSSEVNGDQEPTEAGSEKEQETGTGEASSESENAGLAENDGGNGSEATTETSSETATETSSETATENSAESNEGSKQDKPENTLSTNDKNSETGTLRTAQPAAGAAADTIIQAEAGKKLQEVITDALKNNPLTGLLKIVLSTGSSYTEDLTIQAAKEVGDGFQLEIAAADAGDDNLSADGSTKVTGNILIKGLQVIIKGITLASDKTITLAQDENYEDGALTYFGTKKGDAVNVVSSGGDVSVYTGAGNDQVQLDVKANSRNVRVYTGDGDDTIILGKSDGGKTVDITEALGAGLLVNAGDGSDRITVSSKLANIYRYIQVAGAEGEDGIHLTGSLKGYSDSQKNIVQNGMSLTLLDGSNSLPLTINYNGIERFTDTLQNKKKIFLDSLTNADTGELRFEVKENFVDYVLRSKTAKTIKAFTTNGFVPFLSKLVLDQDVQERKDGVEIHSIDAPSLGVVLETAVLEILGDIKADYVRIQAAYNELSPSMDTIKYDGVSSVFSKPFWQSVGFTLSNLLNYYGHTYVSIKGNIYSAGDVTIQSTVVQDHDTSIIKNPLTAKVSSNVVEIAGKIYAGWDFVNGKIAGTYGNIDVLAKTIVKTKVDEGLLAGVAYIQSTTAVTVGKEAALSAAGNAAVKAINTIENSVTAKHMGNIPFTFATSIVYSQVRNVIEGVINALNGAIEVSAISTILDHTKATCEQNAGLNGANIAVTVYLNHAEVEIKDGAGLSAKGDATITSQASVNGEVSSDAGQKDIPKVTYETVNGNSDDTTMEDVKDAVSAVLGKVLGIVGDKVKAGASAGWKGIKAGFRWIFGKKDKTPETLLKAFGGSNYTVKLDPASNVDKKGSAVLKTNTEGSKLTGVVYVKTEKGASVDRIVVRYLVPGEDHYSYLEVTKAEKNVYSFVVEARDAKDGQFDVLVLYAEDKDAAEFDAINDSTSDTIDISTLFEEAIAGATTEEEEDLDVSDYDNWDVDLRFGKMNNGAVLTKAQDPKKEGYSITKVKEGLKIELIINPNNNYALEGGTLTYTYYKNKPYGDGKFKMTSVIAEDKNGRYIFTVPGEIIIEDGITIDASFVPAKSENASLPKSKSQITGSLSVMVGNNDSLISVGKGASIVSDGSVLIKSLAVNKFVTKADGTAAEKGNPSNIQKAPVIEKENETSEKTYLPNYNYSVRVKETIHGQVTQQAAMNGNAYVFAAAPNAGYKVSSAKVSYRKSADSDVETMDLVYDEAKDVYYVDATKFAPLDGSIADIQFLFEANGDVQDAAAGQDGTSYHKTQMVKPYSVHTVVTAVTTASGIRQKAGDLTLKKAENGVLYFELTRYTAKGYDIAALIDNDKSDVNVLGVSFTDGQGVNQKVALTYDKKTNLWSFDTTKVHIAPGCDVEVYAKFSKQLHKVIKDEGYDPKEGHGTFETNLTEVKASDQLMITQKADAGYVAAGVKVVYMRTGDGAKKIIDLDVDQATYDKDKNAIFYVDIPEMWKGSLVRIIPMFSEKKILVEDIASKPGTDKEDAEYVLPADKVGAGEAFTVTPSADKVKDGYKVKEVEVTYINKDGKQTTLTFTGGKVSVPMDISAAEEKIRLKVTLMQKNVAVEKLEDEKGTLTPEVAYAECGEKVYVTASPAEGYIVKQGSLKANLVTDSASVQVVLKRVSVDRYYFVLPASETFSPDELNRLKVTLSGEFEEGFEDDGKQGTSAGVAITVSVVNSDNIAEVNGNLFAGKDVTILAESGKETDENVVETTSKAGYSKGKTGVAGAIAVQVVSMDTAARVNKGAWLNAKGTIDVDARTHQKLTTVASGKGDDNASGDTVKGVGAGIAVAVRGVDTLAIIEDDIQGITGENLTDLKVQAVQKIEDTVKADAGAKGGSSFTPAAAVDVTGGSAQAIIGKFIQKKMEAGKITVIAQNDAKHTILADGKSAGDQSAIGGSIVVDVIHDSAEAQLKQPVKTNNLNVNSVSNVAVSATANASAAGGNKGNKKKNGSSGSLDKQTDKILNGAGSLASQVNSKNISQAKVTQLTSNRQKAQTTEGSVAGAGALVVSVVSNKSASSIADDCDAEAEPDAEGNGGEIRVTSVNRTSAQIKANASAVQSDTGVGIGVAINIVNADNTAYVGNGKIKAAKLIVTAEMPEKQEEEQEEAAADKDEEEAYLEELYKSVEGFVRDLLRDTGIPETAIEMTSGTIATFTQTFINDVATRLGITSLFKGEGLAANLGKIVDYIVSIPSQMASPLVDLIKDLVADMNLSDEESEELYQELKNDLITSLKGQLGATAGTLVSQLKKEAASLLKDVVKGKLEGKTVDYKTHLTDLKNNLIANLVGQMQEAGNVVIRVISARSNTLSVARLNQIRETIQNGVGSLTSTYADNLLSNFRQNVFDYEAVLEKTEKDDVLPQFRQMMVSSLRESLSAAGADLSTKMIDSLLNNTDVQLKAENVSDKHVIKTQAISGAGATDVGVAGSVAITVVNINTKAQIADGKTDESRLDVTGLVDVRAVDQRRVTTIASAAVNASGDAASNTVSNKDAGNASTGDKKKPEYHTIKAADVTGAKNDKVTVSVTGNHNQTTASDTIKAIEGDEVHVTVQKVEGKRLASLTYTYNDGTRVETKAIEMMESRNKEETVYYFIMPKADVTSINAVFEDGEDDDQSSKTATGKSVGVGASFAFVYGSSSTQALVGNREVKAGTLNVEAVSDHREKTTTVSGTDPLQSAANSPDKQTAVHKTAVDASVAINGSNHKVLAQINGAKDVVTSDESHNEIRSGLQAGDLKLIASETGETDTRASGFSTGKNTAVGAAVAINVSKSKVDALLTSNAMAAGRAVIQAMTDVKDDTHAFATAIGADIQKYLDNVTSKVEAGTDAANQVMDGSIFDEEVKATKEDNSKNETANTVNEKLNDSKTENGSNASSNLSTSTNALRTSGATTSSANEANGATGLAGSKAEEAAGNVVNTNGTDLTPASKVQAAAAVGVSVLDHQAHAVVGYKLVSALDTIVNAVNHGNYTTLGTGIGMSLAEKASSIGVAVAMAVNKSEAMVTIKDSLKSEQGGIELKSDLTQNMTDEYKGQLGAQAIAGAVSGKDSSKSLAFAVATIVSNAKSKVEVMGGSKDQESSITAKEDVTVTANDQSKLAVRAGGISISKGSSIGAGASFAVIFGNNEVVASIGNHVKLAARNLILEAKKQGVSAEDYKSALSMRDLITDSSKLTPEQRQEAETGIVDFRKNADGTYQVKVKLSAENLLDGVSLLNFLASTNYYAEAISGSLQTGSSKFNAAGSFSLVHLKNIIKTMIGDFVTIDLAGDLDMDASAQTNGRVIGGSLSAAPTAMGVGATFAYTSDKDDVLSHVGEGTVIKTAGNYKQNAQAENNLEQYTGAASIASGQDGEVALGGTVNVIDTDKKAVNRFGKGVVIGAAGKASITSDTDADMILITVDAQGSSGKAAAGGAISVIVDSAQSLVESKDGDLTVKAGDDLTIQAKTTQQLISGMGSASVARGSLGAAGGVSVLVNEGKANVKIGSVRELSSAKGSVKVLADSDALAVNADLAAAYGEDFAGGAAINVNHFGREAIVDLGVKDGAAKIDADKDVLIQSCGRDFNVIATLAATGSASGSALSGGVSYVKADNKVESIVDVQGDSLKVHAGEDIAQEAHYNAQQYIVSGGMALVGGTAGVAGAAVTFKNNNQVTSAVKKADAAVVDYTADAKNTLADPGRLHDGSKYHGIYFGATSGESLIAVAVGGAGASSYALSGSLLKMDENNQITADAGKANLTSGQDIIVKADNDMVIGNYAGVAAGAGTAAAGAAVNTQNTKNETKALLGSTVEANGDVLVKAEDTTVVTHVTGSITAAGNASAGGAADTLTFKKNVTAKILEGAKVSGRDVAVRANGQEEVNGVVISAGGSGTFALNGCVALVETANKVHGLVGKNAQISARGSAAVEAKDDQKVLLIAGAAAGSGSVALAPGVVVYTQEDDVLADVEDAKIQAEKEILVNGERRSRLNTDAFAGSGSGAVAGAAASVTVIANAKTQALVKGSELKAIGSGSGTRKIQILAQDVTSQQAAAAGGAVGGGLGLSAAGSVILQNKVVAAKATGSQLLARHESSAKDDLIRIEAVDENQADLAAAGLGGGTVGISGTAGVYKTESAVDAVFDGSAKTDHFKLNAVEAQKVNLKSGALSAGMVGAGATFTTLLLDGKTTALVGNGSSIEATKDIEIQGTSKEEMDLKSAAGSAGLVGVGGTAAVVSSSTSTTAQTGSDVTLTSGRNTTVKAKDEAHYGMLTGNVAAGLGGVGGAVNVLNMSNTVKALIGKNNRVTTGSDLAVKAETNRQIKSTTVSGAGGLAGVTGSVSLITVGKTSASPDVKDALKEENGKDSAERLQSQANGAVSSAKLATGDDQDEDTRDACEHLNSLLGGVKLNVSSACSGAGETDLTYAGVEESSQVKAGGNVYVEANDETKADVDAGADAAGAAAVGGSVAITNLNGTVLARVAGEVETRGLLVKSNEKIEADNDTLGGTAGFVGLGGSVSRLNVGAVSKASVTGTGTVKASRVDVRSNLEGYAKTNAKAASLGGAAGVGTVAETVLSGETLAEIADKGKTGVTADTISIISDANMAVESKAAGLAVGGFTASDTTAKSIVRNKVTARESNALLNAETVIIEANMAQELEDQPIKAAAQSGAGTAIGSVVNTAHAINQAVVTATASSDTGVVTGDNVYIRTNTRNLTDASVTALTAGLVTVGVSDVLAQERSSTISSASDVRSRSAQGNILSVTTNAEYDTKASAQPSTGVFSLGEIKNNTVKATQSAVNAAYIDGSYGNFRYVDVLADSKVDAKADLFDNGAYVSGVKVGVNDAIVELKNTQAAYVDAKKDCGGKDTVLVVRSVLEGTGKADGLSTGGASVVSGEGSSAKVTSENRNDAYIKADSSKITLTGKELGIKADTKVALSSDIRSGSSVSVVDAASISSRTESKDVTKTGVDKAQIKLSGDVQIGADSKATMAVKAETPKKGSGVKVSTIDIGSSSRETADVSLTGGATLTGGSVKIWGSADSVQDTQVRSSGGNGVAIANYNVTNKADHTAKVLLKDAKIQSSKLEVAAESKDTSLKANNQASNVSILWGDSSSKAINELSQNAQIVVDHSDLDVKGDLNMAAKTGNNVSAKADNSNGGLVSKGNVQAKNGINRTAMIIIRNGSELRAGSMDLKTELESSDLKKVYTEANASGKGGYVTGDTYAQTKLKDQTGILVKDSKLKADRDLKLQTKNDLVVEAKAIRNAGAGYASPVTNADLKTEMNNKISISGSLLKGEKVLLDVIRGHRDVTNLSKLSTGAALESSSAYSTWDLGNTFYKLLVKNSRIETDDLKAQIRATTVGSTNTKSSVDVSALTGKARADARRRGNVTAKIYVNAASIIKARLMKTLLHLPGDIHGYTDLDTSWLVIENNRNSDDIKYNREVTLNGRYLGRIESFIVEMKQRFTNFLGFAHVLETPHDYFAKILKILVDGKYRDYARNSDGFPHNDWRYKPETAQIIPDYNAAPADETGDDGLDEYLEALDSYLPAFVSINENMLTGL